MTQASPRLERLVRSTRPAGGGTRSPAPLSRAPGRAGSVPSELHASAQKRIEGLTRLLAKALERALPKTTRLPQVVHEGMRYCVFSGGKRFRPLLCLGACEAVGAPPRRALAVACALECLHTYSLVHDDLPAMDNADQRRGQPTCHRKFGEGNAILVGDALLTLAFELLSASTLRLGPRPWPGASLRMSPQGGVQAVPAPRACPEGSTSLGTESRAKVEGLSRNGASNSLAIIRLLGQACGTGGLIGGQVLDLQAISQPRMATERSLREIAERKTAALIVASVVAGAMAGGASPQQVRWLACYGKDLGLAFQLLDDVHDREGLAQAMGSDRALTEAQRLIARAVKRLEPFGARAQVLRQLAAWLATSAP